MKTIGNYVLRFHNLLSQQKLREKAEEMHKLNNKLKSKTKWTKISRKPNREKLLQTQQTNDCDNENAEKWQSLQRCKARMMESNATWGNLMRASAN